MGAKEGVTMSPETSQKGHVLSAILLIIAALLTLIPFIYVLILSFLDYSLVQGLVNSPFVGLSHYARILKLPQFSQLLGNSFLLWFGSLAGAWVLGVLLSLLFSLIKSQKTAATCAGLVLLPLFIPSSVYFAVITHLFSTQLFVNEKLYPLGFVVQTILPGAALITFSGLVVGNYFRLRNRNTVHGSLLGCLIAALLFGLLTLSPQYEASLLSANPLVYRVADTLENFSYRQSLMQMDLGPGSALFILRSVIQLALSVIPAVLLVVLLRKKMNDSSVSVSQNSGTASPGSWIGWVIAAVLSVALLLVMGSPQFADASQVMPHFLTSLVTAVLATVIGMAACTVFLYAAKDSGPVVTVVIAAVVLGTSNAIIGQYMIARTLRMGNTLVPTVLTQWMQPPVLVLIFLFALMLQIKKSTASAFLLAGSAALFTGAQAYGSFMPQLLFSNNPRWFTMGLVFRNAIMGPAGQGGNVALVYIMLLVPCLLLGFASAILVRQAILRQYD
jgi:putative aldouronate transport system permease protein